MYASSGPSVSPTAAVRREGTGFVIGVPMGRRSLSAFRTGCAANMGELL